MNWALHHSKNTKYKNFTIKSISTIIDDPAIRFKWLEYSSPKNFKGDPILLPLDGNVKEIAKKYWNELNSENRVSLFTREIRNTGEDNLHIINNNEFLS